MSRQFLASREHSTREGEGSSMSTQALEGARAQVVTQVGQALEPYVTRRLQCKYNNVLCTV